MGWLERNRSAIIFSLINFLIFGIILFFIRQPPQGAIEVLPPPPTSTPTPTPSPAPARVYVAGAVVHPDVYTVPAGSLIKDALNAAGGPSADADLLRVNLAQVVVDQMQIIVPRMGETDSVPAIRMPVAPAIGSKSESHLVNINTASEAELDTLPGIGPTLARRIIEYRPYRTIQDIMNVPGIGEGTYQKLKDYITVQ